ncbi:MAG: CcoQ/FixQ family Cbb3-type cytochrome c oxidase assembly chaperone [Epsilonproteobacteria bacterium]|nr:CcoQ/FixQ family Cbb3-type cytochrome c oxidase assembly chaperone [Campylobacterota bacterium]
MDQELIMTIQGYGKFFIILFVFVVFYSYAYSLYKRQKTGERDFEKYSDIVHDDSFDSSPLEKRDNKIEKND